MKAFLSHIFQIITVVLFYLFAQTGIANETADRADAIDCGALVESIKISPDNIYKDTLFPETIKTAKQICLSLKQAVGGEGSTPDLSRITADQPALKEFGQKAASIVIGQFGHSTVISLTNNFKEMESQLAATNIATGKLPEFRTRKVAGKHRGWFSTGLVEKFEFPQNHPDCTQVAPNKTCVQIFNDFMEAFNPYRIAYDEYVTSQNQQLLQNINRNWERFLDVSKSQTAFEVWLTTVWHRKHFQQDYIVGPPRSQVIALHPQLVYEYVDAAEDGNNAEFGLAIEWFGLNYWNLKVPLGLSIASVYSDRAGISDIRTGVMLHIDNKYTIGWGKRGDVDGFYVSLDFLKLLQNKKQEYERYVR